MPGPSVWILNHYANTPEFPGPTRHVDLAKRLVGRGFRVTIVASSFRAIPGDPPVTGRERVIARDVDGIRFIWLRSSAQARGNDATRVANMLEFGVRLWREGRTRFRGAAPYPDVIVGSTPHLFTPLAGWLLARRFRARFVVEVRDLWPETFVALGFFGAGHPIVRGLRVLERFLYRRADRIVSLLPEAWRYMERVARVPRENVVWIPNGASLRDEDTRPESAPHPFTVMYLGSQGRSNVLDDLLVASGILQTRAPSVRVVLVGNGKERFLLETRAKEMALGNLTFVDSVPKKEIGGIAAKADVFVALLEKTPLYQYGVSLNKLFEYMAAGRPVVLAGDIAHNYVDLAGCGITVPPRDSDALARAIIQLSETRPEELHAMGKRGREYVRQHHSWDVLAERLAEALDDAMRRDPRATIREKRRVRAWQTWKRLLDLAIAVPLLLVLAVPLGLIALAIRLEDGRPAFFRQERMGRAGRPFFVWKLRTMTETRRTPTAPDPLHEDDARITRVGRVLRGLGLDELPQLLNVLAGDMSLVGPRPTLRYQVDHYDAFQRRRLEAKPGITSLAVVSGRNALSWNERIEMDVWYVDHGSLSLDLRVLVKTLWKVLVVREGVYGSGGVNDEFVGGGTVRPPGEGPA